MENIKEDVSFEFWYNMQREALKWWDTLTPEERAFMQEGIVRISGMDWDSICELFGPEKRIMIIYHWLIYQPLEAKKP